MEGSSIIPENDFSVSQDQWEENVFSNAHHFTVFRFFGRHQRESKVFETWPEALADAEGDKRALIYAVTLSGRQVCCVPAKWPRYHELWNSK